MLMLLMTFACREELAIATRQLDCNTSETEVSVGEVTDLAFSGIDMLTLLGDPAYFEILYEDNRLGYLEEGVTFSNIQSVGTARVSRTGSECWGYSESALEVLQVRLTADVDTVKGAITVNDGGTYVLEAYAPDRASTTFVNGGTSAGTVFSVAVWEAFFDDRSVYRGADCIEDAFLSGPLEAGEWSLNIDCDTNGDGSPEFSGSWLDGLAVITP